MAPARPSFWNSVCSRIIYGFASREHCVKVLKDQADGTFLLRFSESFLSGNYINSKGGLVVVIQKDGEISLPLPTPPFPSPTSPHICYDVEMRGRAVRILNLLCLSACVCVCLNFFQMVSSELLDLL